MRNMVALTFIFIHSQKDSAKDPGNSGEGPRSGAEAELRPEGRRSLRMGVRIHTGPQVGLGFSTHPLLTRSFIFCRVCSPGCLQPPLPLPKVLLLRSVARGSGQWDTEPFSLFP